MMITRLWGLALVAAALTAPSLPAEAAPHELLNSSYDVSRELFTDLNPVFTAQWQTAHGEPVMIKQSHAGSSSQARAIIQGLKADVVTFNQPSDIDSIARAGLIDPKWRDRLPNQSAPFYSPMAFLVRQGNPKQIYEWQDLTRDGVGIVMPNPKTSGNARYAYLNAWLAASQAHQGARPAIEAFMQQWLKHVVVFDSGGRGATTSFVERGLGDVLISFESEVKSIQAQHPESHYDVIVPKVNVMATFPVSWVDRVVSRNGNDALARAYLTFLYAPEAQRIIAQHFYRVRDPEVVKAFNAQFPAVELNDINAALGDWNTIQREHFATGGTLDRLLRAGTS